MPLQEIYKSDFPGSKWEAVYRHYRQLAAWYSGDPEQLAHVYAEMMPNTPGGMFWGKIERETRRTMLHIPLASDIARISATLLFSEPPKIKIAEAHQENAPADAKRLQEWLDEMIHSIGFMDRLTSGAETCAAMGGVVPQIGWDPELSEYPIIEFSQADAAIPVWSMGMLRGIMFFRALEEQALEEQEQEGTTSTVWRHVQLHEPGWIYNGLYKGTQDVIGMRHQLTEKAETAALQEAINTGIEGLAALYVPNMLPNRRFRAHGWPIGYADIDGAEGMLDALDEAYTNWWRDIRLGRGRILVNEQYTTVDTSGKKIFDIDQEVYQALAMSPGDTTPGITPVQFAIRTEEHKQACEEMLGRIVSHAGYSPQTFGLKIEGRTDSGYSLDVQERLTFLTAGQKAGTWKNALESMLYKAILIANTQMRAGLPTEYRPTVEMQDSVRFNLDQVARSVSLLRAAEVISIETGVMMTHPDWTKDQVDAEVKRITAEKAAGLPDPMQTGQV